MVFNMSSNLKKPKVNFVKIPVLQKMEILKQLNAGGTTISELARTHGVSRTAIRYIKLNEKNITAFAKSNTLVANKRKSMKSPANINLDESLYIWYCQARQKGIPISGPLLCEKAMSINEKLGGPTDFKASHGWLQSFRNRHGIRQMPVEGEKLSAHVEALKKFQEYYAKFIRQNGDYKDQNIYNADETGLNWKNFPSNASALESETSCSGYEEDESRITILVCANKDGSHRLPLFVIGKHKNPRCLKNVKQLPVVYASQKSALMDKKLFLDWYKNIFIPSVKAKQGENLEKVLLLLDKAPSHPTEEFLNAVDELFHVKFFPANVTSLIQPMDQGVIKKIKRLYRKDLLKALLLSNEELQAPRTYLQQFNLKNCFQMIASAFQCLTEANLKSAWKSLESGSSPATDFGIDMIDSEVLDICQQIPALSNFSSEEIKVWLQQDAKDQGWKPLEIEERIQFTAPQAMKDPLGDVTIKKEEEQNIPDERTITLSDVEAFRKIKKWYQETASVSEIELLEDIRCLDRVERHISKMVLPKDSSSILFCL